MVPAQAPLVLLPRAACAAQASPHPTLQRQKALGGCSLTRAVSKAWEPERDVLLLQGAEHGARQVPTGTPCITLQAAGGETGRNRARDCLSAL